MNKIILFITTALFSFFIGCSNTQSDKTPTDAASNGKWKDTPLSNDNSLLWKIEGNQAKPSYLFGTMHLIEKEYFNFSPPLTERILASESIMMEIAGMPDPFAAYKSMKLDSGTVHDYFTPIQMKELLQFMDTEMNTAPDQFHQQYGPMKPFFILQSLAQNSFEGETSSYDLTIMQLAGENDIPLVGFETFEQQLGLFEKIPQEDMTKMIMESITDIKDTQKEMKKLMKLYSEQKVDKFIPMMKKQSPEIMKFSEIFLTNRNIAWIPKIEKEIKNKQSFIAVGAAHLFDEGGIIELLRKQGYTLTPVSTEN